VRSSEAHTKPRRIDTKDGVSRPRENHSAKRDDRRGPARPASHRELSAEFNATRHAALRIVGGSRRVTLLISDETNAGAKASSDAEPFASRRNAAGQRRPTWEMPEAVSAE
jgi:hypothetical protein